MPAEVKQQRLQECISAFREEAARVNSALIDSTQLVLVEGVSPSFLVNTTTVNLNVAVLFIIQNVANIICHMELSLPFKQQ